MRFRFKEVATIATFLLAIYTPTALVFFLVFKTDYRPIDNFEFVRWVMLVLFVPLLFKYIVQLLLAPWYPLVEKLRRPKSNKYKPEVSVLIPAWNEEVGILNTIKSVLATHYPKLQVVVINDGSTDGTHEVVSKFMRAKRLPLSKLKYIRVPNGGKARALNSGLKVADGEIVITIDADSVMSRYAIVNLVKHFVDDKVMSVAGNVVIGNRRKVLGLIQQLEYNYGFYFKRADSILNSIYIVGGAAAAYRKEVVLELGGFDEDMITEDIELSTRLQDRGHSVRYAPDAIIYTEGPSDFLGLCRQRLRWKYGRLLTFFKYKHLFFSFRKEHNLFLTYVILPIALFSELLLFFEGILLVAFFYFVVLTNDYFTLAVVISVLSCVIALQVLTDRELRYHKNLLLLAPGAWIIFYFMDFVEYQALVRSIARLVRRKELVWQRWNRVGVFEE